MNDYDTTELRDNNCIMTFSCNNPMDTSCVYFMNKCDSNDDCDFAEINTSSNNYYCRSAVACVNKMTVNLKQMGVGLVVDTVGVALKLGINDEYQKTNYDKMSKLLQQIEDRDTNE